MQDTIGTSKQGSANTGPGASCKWKKTHFVDQKWRSTQASSRLEAKRRFVPVSYTHLRAHETRRHL
eukprot:6458047-Prorocentrum_lima.AAC.1